MKNEISYERIMDALYYELYNMDLEKNVFETDELMEKLNNYTEKYIEPVFAMSSDLCDAMSEGFLEVVSDYCRRGFEVGFQAAVALLGTKAEVLGCERK